jgi:rhomboid protease GluP
LQPLHQQLVSRVPKIWVTIFIIAINLVIFVAMLMNGAGLWHSSRNVQLAWGANFGPATQYGEWWRLASALFLHFGVIHLALNMWSLWDVGQLVERMYKPARFVAIYLLSGLFGNLVSLVMHGNAAVSGGASGAIFGLYAAAFVFLWRERAAITVHEFRWLFWGALGFSSFYIIMGFFVPVIDNAAHIGGFIAGALTSIVFSQSITARIMPIRFTLAAASAIILGSALLFVKMPAPIYKWSDELLLRDEISAFTFQNQAINRSWLEIVNESKQGKKSSVELANQIDSAISAPLDQSLQQLSTLPQNQALPSAAQLEQLKQYTEERKAATTAIADKLRAQP